MKRTDEALRTVVCSGKLFHRLVEQWTSKHEKYVGFRTFSVKTTNIYVKK